MAALLYHQLLSGLAPAPAFARVEPLTRITRQIHKPNMLIVLDTSGSLTGVPGGSFDYTDEVGVDCDDGVNCRGGVSIGTCDVTGKTCSTDAQCASGTCQTGMAPCASDPDCMPVAGTCSTGQNCFADVDCPARTTGRCAYDNHTCNTSDPCSARMRCRYGSNVSCSTNNDCRPGVCANGSTTCSSNNDCPYATSGGTCAYGTTPVTGCAQASDCPVRPKVCSDNPNLTCNTVNDCGGVCKKAGTACNSNANCTTQSGDSCQFTGKTCSSPDNSCILPRTTCGLLYTDNICQNTNSCVPDANACTGASANACLSGSAGDVCNASGTTSGSRMCRLGQSKCSSDSQCPVSGDSCGPATSRMVIAKRVIRSIVGTNANVVNLGLMTFHQAGYFPYYVVGGSTTSTTSTVDLKQGTLQGAGCYSKKTGLATTCTVHGKSYTLKASNNAKYLIKGHGNSGDKYIDATYCGYFCNIPGQGTGIFKGGHYEYTDVVGTLGAQVDFPTYRGKVFTEGGVTYRYYDARPDLYNGGAPPPIETVNCGSSCSATCGARWDTQLAPFLTTNDTQANIDATIAAFNQAMEPADDGGLIAYNGTPIGCTLENNVVSDKNHSAYHYMQEVKNNDSLTCRLNFVLLVTDGEANGPGDTNCTAAACAADNPETAGCTCRAVLAAWNMRKPPMNVKTFVVGFSTDAATGTGRTINNNIAKAGGTDVGGDGVTPYSYGATNEAQLMDSIQNAIYQAVQGSYSTSPATASQGTTTNGTEQSGNLLLDARVDFPTWRGHLVAYDVSGASPVLSWDAATKLESMDWKTRRVYTSDASDNLVRIEVDPSTGEILNKGALHTLGLGTNATEAEQIARWMLGDPALGNPAVLGSIINSTPIDVGAPADGTSPGLHAFFLANKDRPSVTYVGSDDGMLHAFYTRDATVNGTTYLGGNEAWAYMPRSMLKVATKLYAQGGQVADPRQHIYGLASSPKVKSICTANCTSDSATWKTVLVMTEGWGGNGIFMLDVTNPAAATPFGLMWTSASDAQAATYDSQLGHSASVPAFTFLPSGPMDDFRVLMASGYPTTDGSATQGRYLVSSSVLDGTITPASTLITPGGSCAQDFTLLTDVGTARRQTKDSNGTAVGRKEFLAGYFGDTWGNLWMYTPTHGAQLVADLGCDHPLHFSPTVVQPDADDPNNPNAGQIYLIQVTNSSLDVDTENFPTSQMVIVKQTFSGASRPVVDTNFGSGGKITLTSANPLQLCGETNSSGTACLTPLPANARPLATPTGILKSDGTGFVTFSNWYAPASAGCGKGSSYLLVHDFSGSSFVLKQAVKIADEPVVNPIIVKGNLVVSTSTGPMNIAGTVTTKIVNATEPRSNLGDAFQMSGWTEIQ